MRLLSCLILLGCADAPTAATAAPPVEAAATAAPWTDPASRTVADAFPLPTGAVRVPTDGFGASLRDLALRPPGTPVMTHDGRSLGSRDVRVVDLPLVRGDLQQCADSAIRLRAEWQRDHEQPVAFHATSGDLVPWSRVQGGELPYAQGSGLRWRRGTTDWDGYLRLVFTWAGTASLEVHDTVPALEPRGGDLLVQGGFPGHAVVVLDAAKRGEQTLLLLGQGFMPAQDFHVLVGPHEGWWAWETPLDLPSWSFERSHLRRWKPSAG